MKIPLLLFILYSLSFLDSNDKNLDRLFITCLYQDNIISLSNGMDPLEYINSINIDLDSIGGNNFYSLKLVKFTLGKNEIKLNINDDIEILFNSSSCNEYVIAYDYTNKLCYKLKGFNNNDLLFLLRDLNKKNYQKKKYKQLLSDLSLITNEIDFNCIYKSLKGLDMEAGCLKSCSEPLPAH